MKRNLKPLNERRTPTRQQARREHRAARKSTSVFIFIAAGSTASTATSFHVRCHDFKPDHNGECLNCDEWADAHGL